VKLVSTLIGALLVIAFVAPPALKLKELALVVVILIGLVLMAIDLWQSLHERD